MAALTFDVLVLHNYARFRDFLNVGRDERPHLQILRPEIDGRFISTQKILCHLLERRWTECAHRAGQALHPPEEKEGHIQCYGRGDDAVMKIERTAVNGMPVMANWFVTPSPQSSTYAVELFTIT